MIYHVYVCDILYIYMDLPNPALCRIVWQLSLLIHSTLENVTTNMTLQNRFFTKIVCGLCVPSFSSTVHCVPSVCKRLSGRFVLRGLSRLIRLDLL